MQAIFVTISQTIIARPESAAGEREKVVRQEPYKYHKKWRLVHTAQRNAERKRYYKKFQNAKDGGKRWEQWEIKMILAKEHNDRTLSKILSRSIQAIQVKRSRIKPTA